MENLDLGKFLARLKSIISLARRYQTHSGIRISFSELEKIKSDFIKQGYFREAEDVDLIIEFLRQEKDGQDLKRQKIVEMTAKLSKELPVGRMVVFRHQKVNLTGSVVGFLGDRLLVSVTNLGVKNDIYEVSPLDIKV